MVVSLSVVKVRVVGMWSIFLFGGIGGRSTVQYSTAQHSTVQYSTVQYEITQFSAVQYSRLCTTVAPATHLSLGLVGWWTLCLSFSLLSFLSLR